MQECYIQPPHGASDPPTDMTSDANKTISVFIFIIGNAEFPNCDIAVNIGGESPVIYVGWVATDGYILAVVHDL